MNKLTFALSVIGTIAVSTPAFADLEVRFIEGAPKDRFVIKNVGNCALGAGKFEIDFKKTRAGLIFDVTGNGAGVEVFQPFQVTSGAKYLKVQPSIKDGDKRAILDMKGLGVNETLAFTIDVDDTKGTRAITVANSEITGTVFSFNSAGRKKSAVMGAKALVNVATPACDA